MHRLREALRNGGLAPMGGAGEVVEVDETRYRQARRRSEAHLSGLPAQQWRNTVLDAGTARRSVPAASMSKALAIAVLLPIIRANIANRDRRHDRRSLLVQIARRHFRQPRSGQPHRRRIRAPRLLLAHWRAFAGQDHDQHGRRLFLNL